MSWTLFWQLIVFLLLGTLLASYFIQFVTDHRHPRRGPQGPPGPQGPMGESGYTGPTGATGAPGPPCQGDCCRGFRSTP